MCQVCGEPFAGAGVDHLCHRCLTQRPSFGVARACITYLAIDSEPSPLARTIQRYKYGPDASLAPALSTLLLRLAPPLPRSYDFMVPVPLHISRLRWRGFNQAHWLARSLAHQQQISIDPFVLERTRATAPQVQLDMASRRRNVTGAFRVTDTRRVHDRSVLLIDDVYTTGATANECSRTLRRAGAAAVDVLVLARAVTH